MARESIELRQGVLQRELDVQGLDYSTVGRLIERDRRSVWRLATGRVPRASIETAQRLVWVLDVRPSHLFVMPVLALPKGQPSDRPASPPN